MEALARSHAILLMQGATPRRPPPPDFGLAENLRGELDDLVARGVIVIRDD